MSDLSEFLLARIADDEAESRWLGPCDCRMEGFPLQHGLRCAERVLAECDAKRRIVHRFQMFSGMTELTKMEIRHNELLDVLHWLALPYADHPDYREEWRP